MEREKTVTLTNEYGLHARPATLFVETCNRFSADVLVVKGDQEVNGKSIMGIMMLGAEKGTSLTLRASGEDADEAIEALASLVEDGFGENGDA
jgi:phosphocarrier protein